MRQAEAILDFGSSKIVCMIGRCGEDGRFEIYGIGNGEHKGLKKKRFLDEPGLRFAVQTAIEGAQSEARRRIRSVHVGVPGPFVRAECGICEMTLGEAPREILHKDIDALMEAAVKEAETPEGFTHMFSVPYHYRVDGSPRNSIPAGVFGKTLWAAVSHMYFENSFCTLATDILDEMGVDVDSFVDSAFAEAAMLVKDKREESIVVDVGYYHTDVIVMRDAACVFRAAIPVGGAHITSDISYVLSISPAVAESVKQRHAFGLDYSDRVDTYRLTDGTVESIVYDDIQDIIEARAYEIASMVREAIMKSAVQVMPETPLYLMGGGIAMMRGSKELFQSGSGFYTIADMPWMPRKNTPNFVSAYGMLNYVCNSALSTAPRTGIKENRLIRAIMNFFTK